MKLIIAFLLLALYGSYVVWRRRRRASAIRRLHAVVRTLATNIGRGELETIEKGKIVLRVDGSVVRVDIARAFDVVENTEPRFLHDRIQWLIHTSESD